jgi:hypothetical protein
MPLGFAKSVLTKADDSFELGYWKQTAGVNTGGGSCARFTETGSGQSNTQNFTFSCWFRASDSEWDSDFDGTEAFTVDTGSTEALKIDFHKDNGINILLFENGSAGAANFTTGNSPKGQSFNSTYIDNNWHHLFVQARFGALNASVNRIFLDGEDCTTYPFSGDHGPPDNPDNEYNFWGRGTAVKEYGGDVAQVWLEMGTSTDWLGCKTSAITGATAANPVVITSASHGRNDGDVVAIHSVVGMTQLNGNTYTVANKTANTFQLSGINGSGYTAYGSAGQVVDRGSDTNIDKWRTSAGGPVDLGTTGTPAGLSQPDVYIYIDSSGNFAEGGSASGSLSEAGSGTTESATGGPST